MSTYTEILEETDGSIEKLIEMGPDLSDMSNNQKGASVEYEGCFQLRQ
jgi:hypothetical protein